MTISQNAPWFATASRRKHWLVGVSGGADSVALLHLLVAAGFSNLVICHLDHGLRGRESAADARFVERLALRLGLEYEIGRADVAKQMAVRRESMETAARNARHEFFADCVRKTKCSRLLLAHHADDQAETVLWNLLRGSHGMKGMRQEHQIITESGVKMEIYRPLLAVRRQELRDWLLANKKRWREDASNAEPITIRNRLRHEALPLLGEISGRDAVSAFTRGAEDAEALGLLENWALERAKAHDPQGRLHLGALKLLPPIMQRLVIRKFLTDHGIAGLGRDLIERCTGLLDLSHAAVINLPGGGKFRRRAGRLWIELE